MDFGGEGHFMSSSFPPPKNYYRICLPQIFINFQPTLKGQIVDLTFHLKKYLEQIDLLFGSLSFLSILQAKWMTQLIQTKRRNSHEFLESDV